VAPGPRPQAHPRRNAGFSLISAGFAGRADTGQAARSSGAWSSKEEAGTAAYRPRSAVTAIRRRASTANAAPITTDRHGTVQCQS